MKALRFEAVPSEKGKLVLVDDSLEVGQSVEVIILLPEPQQPDRKPYALRGTLLKYDQPFEPAVPDEDWNAMR
jgi:hypothetical protein